MAQGDKARRTLICGNWKMNLTPKTGVVLAQEIVAGLDDVPGDVDIAVCPSAPSLVVVQAALEPTRVALGGQDCHADVAGAHTGDVSVAALAEIGCRYVIVGHSERRADHGETDAVVRAKAAAALGAGLTPIVCVGETLADREADRAVEVVSAQVAGSVPPELDGAEIVVAYEPVWAIGTGKVASTADVDAMHRAIRAKLGDLVADAGAVRLLYGGSVKPDNAADLLSLADVDGALVGGASLKAADFLAIAKAVKSTA